MNKTLDHVVPASRWRSGITIRCSNSAFFQQPHQFPHGIGDYNLRVPLHQDIQLGILAGLRFFACSIEAALCRDRCSRCFQDFGDIRAVGDGPSSFFYSSGQ